MGERGFALVIVLWAGVLLSVIAASFAFSMRTETRLATNLVTGAKAQALAEAGIRRGILALLMPRSDDAWISDGRGYTLPFGEGEMRVRILSENGKIDLNGAPEALIEGLLSSFSDIEGGPSAEEVSRITAAILDWRDADGRARPGGAEDSDYRALGKPHGARDGAFLSVAELNQVMGMRAEIYAQLVKYVTVHSWMPQVDPTTAPREVLLAVPGLDAGVVDRYLAAREALYAREEADEGEARRLPLELLSAGARYLSRARARVYTVEAEGNLPDGARARRRAVIRLSGDAKKPYSIIAWFDSVPDSEAIGRE
jgi:general secretion pathway protein K